MIGKLQLAAMANASPHHKGDVLILKQHAEDNGNHTQKSER